MLISVNIYFFKAGKETLEKGVKYVQSYYKKHQNDENDVNFNFYSPEIIIQPIVSNHIVGG